MVSNVLVTVRVDRFVKEEAASILAEMGLTVSDAVRLMLIKISKEQALPFDRFVPNEETVEALMESRRGRGKSFNSVKDLMKDLLTESEDTLWGTLAENIEKTSELASNEESIRFLKQES